MLSFFGSWDGTCYDVKTLVFNAFIMVPLNDAPGSMLLVLPKIEAGFQKYWIVKKEDSNYKLSRTKDTGLSDLGAWYIKLESLHGILPVAGIEFL